MKRCRPADDCSCNQVAVEGCEFTPVRRGKGKKIRVGDLIRVEHSGAINPARIEQANIIGPELMSSDCSEHRYEFGNRSRSARRIRITRMTDDPHNSILGQRTTRPGTSPLGREPVMRTVMLHMGWIDQSHENIHVEKEPGHGTSSIS